MKNISRIWNNRLLGLSLVLISISIYYLQVVLFHDARNTTFYILQDLAFVPLQVLIVTLILEQILNAREKREIKRKQNVVINVFYSEVGTKGIALMAPYVNNIHRLQELLDINVNWKDEEFKNALKGVNAFQLDINSQNGNLDKLLDLLTTKKAFMLSLFENTNLLEHDTFTDMLWAIFHLMEELESRESLHSLPSKDLEHLSVDLTRAYKTLVVQWIYYMNHLRREYPYLFSLAVRKSPFNQDASVIIN